MNRHRIILSTVLGLTLLPAILLEVAAAQETPDTAYRPPQFRTVAADQPRPDTDGLGTVRLVTDADFAPYSFLTATGAPAGLAVEMALAACTSLAIRCTVSALPFAGLLPALAGNEADAVIAGPRLDAETARSALSTRAYFRIMGRFAAQAVSPLTDADAASLAGRRIGVIGDTLHARWLEAYYKASEIVPFDDGAKAGEALRTGAVDALFGDNLQMIYWVSGAESGACCRLLGGAYSDFDFFSRNMVLLVARDRPDLRVALDYGLDAAQKDGAAASIIAAYLPLSPW